MKKIIISGASILLLILSVTSCFDAKRSDKDPSAPQYVVNTTITPPTGSTVAGHETIVIKWDANMNRSTLSISGGSSGIDSTQALLTWSSATYTDDTLTISVNTTTPKVFWPKGNGKTITVSCTTVEGHVAQITATYDVVYRVYVNNTTGAPTNTGTRALPLSKISDGITYARNLKSGTAYSSETSEVCVAQGTYPTNWAANTDRITMVEGVSLYGGYSASDWAATRNPATYVTTIQDASNSGGANWDDPNRVINCNTIITNITVIDGFTIQGGGGINAAGIFCNSGSSLIIINNKISGGNQSNGYTYGMTIKSSSPIIQNNNIFGGNGSGSSDSYGIYIDGSSGTTSPSIKYNKIDGGTGNSSYGIVNLSSAAYTLYNNTIFGGNGNTYAYAIYNDASSIKIYNNTIDGGYPATTSGNVYCIYISGICSPNIENNILFNERLKLSIIEYGIYESSLSSEPSSFKNNDIYNCRIALYRDHTGTNITSIGSVNGLFASSSGNVNLDPVFTIPTSSSITWFLADHHLSTSSPVNVTQGGRDGVAQGWGFSDDFANSTRTNSTSSSPTNANAAGWSMGAYEKD